MDNQQLKKDNDISKWNELLTKNHDGGNVFQMAELAETKRKNGWMPRYLVIGGVAVTILEKAVFAHGKFWYLPKGPGVTTTAQLEKLLPELRTVAKEYGVFAVKIEPEITETDESRQVLAGLGLVPTAAVQPNSSTVIIDLSPSLEEVLSALNQKGRHAIKRAERDGVTAKPVDLTEENMKLMFDLLSETAAGRFESSIRTYEYYKEFWQRFAADGHGQLFFAYFEGEVVSAAYCLCLGDKGLYKDGASVRKKTAYGASHLLQWEIITWMKERGVTSYDLCGAPHSSAINDESHKFYGVGRFKTSFNKHVTDYVGCYDLVVNPGAYKRWQQFGQRLIVSLTWRLKQQQWF
ncbi:peptidoglycan bridge formation glycyltransferase FemA/FemB family protein [Candidatus Saccharibacteria bacterium]|nr:peptidoglycan bridge formation glycyltransferase FemA/FemB family protein [Candidatus Saccharibacteria bacterium]